jgi:integrase
MARVETRTLNGRTRYYARYRDLAGKSRSRTFDRKGEAERFLTSVEHSKISGTYIDPARAMMTLDVWSQEWLATQTQLKPSTRARYAGIVSKHIVPRWENVPLAKVQHADVAKWISSIELAPASVHYIHRVFSLIMELAVRDGRIPSNPANGVRLSRATTAEKRFLTKAEVFRLADCAGEYRTMILVLSYCGLRWGELAALRVGRVDLMRGRLTVAESAIEVAGHLTWGTPKNHQRRSVPLPRFLCDALAVEVAGKSADDLAFTTQTGKPLRNLNWRRDYFDRAATEAGLSGLTPHELRHTAASLAVSAGANVKSVQRMLGHASAAMTLDVYAGLFGDDLDGLAERLDASVAEVEPVRSAEVIELPQR